MTDETRETVHEPIVCCGTCFALVPREKMDAHHEWHDNLRRTESEARSASLHTSRIG